MSSGQNIVRSWIWTHVLRRGPEHSLSSSVKVVLESEALDRSAILTTVTNLAIITMETVIDTNWCQVAKILSEVIFEPTPSHEDQNTLPLLQEKLSLSLAP